MVKYMNNQSPRTKRKNEGIKGSVFTFFSTASAVGKTVLAVNYAADLAERGYKVCLADLDLQFGDVCNYLGITPEKTLFDYYEQEDNQRDTSACITEIKFGFDVSASIIKPSSTSKGAAKTSKPNFISVMQVEVSRWLSSCS